MFKQELRLCNTMPPTALWSRTAAMFDKIVKSKANNFAKNQWT